MMKLFGDEARSVAEMIDREGKTGEAEGAGVTWKVTIRIRYVEGRTVAEVSF